MIDTRPATEADEAFLWELKRRAMRTCIERVYGWDEDLQLRFFQQDFDPGDLTIVRCREQDVGMYQLDRRADHWYLARLEILPEQQNRGIGTALLRQLMAGAAAADRPLRLQVFKVNRARHLYRRLGFRQTGASDNHVQMEWCSGL